MKTWILTAGDGQAGIIFRALNKEHYRLVVGYEAGRRWCWMRQSEHGLVVETKRLCRRRYPSLVQQWWGVFCAMLTHKPDLLISEGIQGVLTACMARVFLKVRVVYWAVDWFPNDPWGQFLDRLAWNMADDNWAASERIADMSALPRKYVPFLYECSMRPNTEIQRDLIYTGGIRKNANLFWAAHWAKQNDIKLLVLGKIMDADVARGLRTHQHVRIYEDASEEQLHISLRGARYGWACWAGGMDNYSNHAISRKIREYLENGIVPVVAEEHVDYEALSAIATGEQAYQLAKQRERLGREAWAKTLAECFQ